MVDKDHMHSGHGKHACPGRALAVNEPRLTLACFLLHLDLRYLEGKVHPDNKTVDEIVFADPTATVVIKKRKGKDAAVRHLT